MSTNYKYGYKVPSEILCNRLDTLANAVTKGQDEIQKEFRMRIPAEVDYDADLVISEASARIRRLEALLKVNG